MKVRSIIAGTLHRSVLSFYTGLDMCHIAPCILLIVSEGAVNPCHDAYIGKCVDCHVVCCLE